MIAGERDPEVLAEMARARMRTKEANNRLAGLSGNLILVLDNHHRQQ